MNVLPGLPFNQDATGAVDRIVLDPLNTKGAYANSVSGGVFKTGDYTTITAATPTLPAWNTTTDQLPSLSMGALAIDPTNSLHIVAASGCVTSGGICASGGLVYESPDAGATWTVTNDPALFGQTIQGVTVRGQTILVGTGRYHETGGIFRRASNGAAFQSLAGVGGLPASFGAVFDLVADPSTADRYYAVIASNGTPNSGGVYRTDDSGTTWSRISNNDTNPRGLNFALNQWAVKPAAPATSPPENAVSNARLAISPTGKLFVVVALLGQARYIAYTSDQGTTWATMDVSSVLAGTSVTAGGPQNVTSITRAAGSGQIIVDCGTAHGLNPSQGVRLSGVPLFGPASENLNRDWSVGSYTAPGSTTPSTTQFVLIDSYSGIDGTGVTTASNVTAGTWLGYSGPNQGKQANVHLALAADPTTPQFAYLGGDASAVFVARGDHTQPAGQIPSQQWTSIASAGTTNNTNPHVDVRDLVIDPSGNLLAATDGGIYLRTNPTVQGGDWYSVAGNMVAAEMLTVAIDPVSRAVFGGTQDNGTPGSTGAINGTPSRWALLEGADGRGVAAVNAQATDPVTGLALSYRYTTWQGENDFRLHTHDSTGKAVTPSVKIPLVSNATTTPPTLLEDVEDISWMETLVTNPFAPNRVLIGGGNQGVWESLDRGNTVSLVAGSPLGATSIAAGVASNIEAMWVVGSPGFAMDGNRLPNNVYNRFAAGGVSQVAFPGARPLSVTMSPANPQVACVATDYGEVFCSQNGGGAWNNVTGDLTRQTDGVHAGAGYLRDIIYIQHATGGDRIVVAAANNAKGVYMMALANPGVWMRVGINLPRTPATALDYLPATDTLVVGTQGRGAWSVSNVGLLDRAPVAVCAPVTRDADATCQATALASDFNAGSTDPEGNPLTFDAVDPGTLQPLASPVTRTGVGSYPVTIRVSDGQGAAALCSPVNFIVQDKSPPTLTLPADVNIVSCMATQSITVGTATATDNCAVNLVPTGQVISKNGVALSPPIPIVGGQVTLAPGTYVIQWSVSDGWNPTVIKNQTVTVGAAIVASNTYQVRDRASVEDINGNPAAVLNAGTGVTAIGGDNATVGPIVAGGNVTVGWNGYVYGDITAVGSIQVNEPAKHFGNNITVPSVSLPAPPPLPTFPPNTGGDKWVNPGTDLSLPPGSYGSIGVNGNPNPNQAAIVRLAAGDYFFTNLYFNSSGLIVVGQAGTRIFVSGNVTFNTSVVTAVGSTQLAPVVLGVSGSGSLALYAPFRGTILAPGRDLVVGTANGMTFTGSFFARSIDVTPNSTLVCDPTVAPQTPSTCSNSVLNSGETDIDCGGPVCNDCTNGKSCTNGGDCVSKVCTASICQVPTCSDGQQNGTETAVDCGGSCAACPVACNAFTYQAESIFHSTGNAWWQGGWNIYTNGYIAATHNFSPGANTITVSAFGQQAAGVLPHMNVRVGGVLINPSAGYNVTTSGFNPYTFTFNAAGGPQEVRVAFDNDANGPFGDRNLIVRTVAVSCP